MAGWLTDNVLNLPTLTGNERVSVDTQLASGANPQTAALDIVRISTAALYYGSHGSKTLVAGSRYFVGYPVGYGGANPEGIVTPSAPTLITGVNVLIGGTGGTDNWLAELHDANGVLVATSATAGALVGTAGTWQQFAFTSAYSALPALYFIAIQTNGTTATLAVYNSPTSPLLTGTATGTFGTGAAITPPTTYTASDGPDSFLYT